MFNKNIQRIKLSVTTDCNLNCQYCFVKKTAEMMKFGTAKKAVDLLIQSQGIDKIFSIYGGEPLLNYGLLKKIIPYAYTQAEIFRKRITVSCCTNGTLIDENCLSLFRDYNIKLHLSLAGDKVQQDKFRHYSKNRSSYDLIMKKLPLIRKKLSEKDLGVCFCIFPYRVSKMYSGFRHLVDDLEFKLVNFEIIRKFKKWTANAIIDFLSGYDRIIREIINDIPKNKFLYLNSICWELKYSYLSSMMSSVDGSADCPFRFNLEIYPSGDMAFSAFLINRSYARRYLIGNINNGIRSKFLRCRFGQDKNECRECFLQYFYDDNSKPEELYLKNCYNLFSQKAAKTIEKYALFYKTFASYIHNAKQMVS